MFCIFFDNLFILLISMWFYTLSCFKKYQDLFGGASDTTSNTIEWAMVELLQNPEIMKKSQEELK